MIESLHIKTKDFTNYFLNLTANGRNFIDFFLIKEILTEISINYPYNHFKPFETKNTVVFTKIFLEQKTEVSLHRLCIIVFRFFFVTDDSSRIF